LGTGTGNIKERTYIARCLARWFAISKDQLRQALSNKALPTTFDDEYANWGRGKKLVLPPSLFQHRIRAIWEKRGLIQSVRSLPDDSKKRRKLISDLRLSMAEAIIGALNLDLIILDEFQKFRGLINGEFETAKVLLKRETPTLLLSATPYPAFSHENGTFGSNIQLKNLLAFLTDSENSADLLIKQLQLYTKYLLNVNNDDFTGILKQKKSLENSLMHYMARTERIVFESEAETPVTTLILGKDIVSSAISSSHLYEWLKVKERTTCPRTFLHLWKSGQFPMSYMHGKYKILDPCSKKTANNGNSLTRDLRLYSKPGKFSMQSKLEYLWNDLICNGAINNYLWIPPLRPYYKGNGVFSQDKLNNQPIKKGLIFSSWTFVPKYISAEISARLAAFEKGRTPVHPLKDATSTWARFFHPSPWLASIVSNSFFSNSGKNFEDLVREVKKTIRNDLIKKGWKNLNKPASAWKIVHSIDLEPFPERLKTLRVQLSRKRGLFQTRMDDRSSALNEKVLNRIIYENGAQKYFNKQALNELALIALTSPAVCLLRSLQNLSMLDKNKLSSNDLGVLTDFCTRNWKTFFNRESTVGVIHRNGGRGTYPKRLQNYLRDGNIQAMLDEYLFLINPGKTENGINEVITRLAEAIGPKGGNLFVKTGYRKHQKKSVRTEQVTLFGNSDEVSHSRQAVRESFNSPFWPFVLVTTSVGQEGLDFHLYCRNIYHWNLPGNPVDFEQREGRINRYNAFWVRKAICDSANSISDFGWDKLYEDVPSSWKNRVNMEMSPYWTFIPVGDKIKDRGYIRHILTLPGSGDVRRYELLMRDLELYRLTLGHSNQNKYLKELRKNLFLSNELARSLSICLFPFNISEHQKRLYNYYSQKDRAMELILDVKAWLKESIGNPAHKEIAERVKHHLSCIRDNANHKEIKRSLQVLIYCIDPHDEIPDKTPSIGYSDDLKVLRKS
jgi:hypothetical protein